MLISEIRDRFLRYFHDSYKHEIFGLNSVIPHNDKSLLFTNAGMVPLKDYFLGHKSTQNSLTSVQKCIRAGGKHNDLSNVGYTARHHTFFEMLGNFSFGQYFKQQAIEMAWKLLTDEFKVDKSKLYITVHESDNEAYNIWKKLTSFTDDRIVKINTDDNFWSMGQTGPCGPCSEIFYDYGDEYGEAIFASSAINESRYIEIWNLVFMQYERLEDESLVNLPRPCIDTGMGIERIAAVLQGVYDNYRTDIFSAIIARAVEVFGRKDMVSSHKVIADHVRTIAFLVAENILPSNEGRGYVLKRILRRAMRHMYKIKHDADISSFLTLFDILESKMSNYYPELTSSLQKTKDVVQNEFEKFSFTLTRGTEILEDYLNNSSSTILSGEKMFELYDTYGFPLDIAEDILSESGFSFDRKRFEEMMNEQKNRSKDFNKFSAKASSTFDFVDDLKEKYGETKFVGYSELKTNAKILFISTDEDSEYHLVILDKTCMYAEAGGQVGDKGYINDNKVLDVQINNGIIIHKLESLNNINIKNEVQVEVDSDRRSKIACNHSATHILQYVLRKVLGNHVEQKGSLVTEDKLRFDFSYDKKVHSDSLELIESKVNEYISRNARSSVRNMALEEAKKQNALCLFDESYSSEVRVVSIGDSIELCCGTHVCHTSEIMAFKIISEESVASGVRRIEAITNLTAINYLRERSNDLDRVESTLSIRGSACIEGIIRLQKNNKNLEEKNFELVCRLALINSVLKNCEHYVLLDVSAFNLESIKNIKVIADRAYDHYKKCIIIINSSNNTEYSIVIKSSKELGTKANDLLKYLMSKFSGNGGGSPMIAQAGGLCIPNSREFIDKLESFFSES